MVLRYRVLWLFRRNAEARKRVFQVHRLPLFLDPSSARRVSLHLLKKHLQVNDIQTLAHRVRCGCVFSNIFSYSSEKTTILFECLFRMCFPRRLNCLRTITNIWIKFNFCPLYLPLYCMYTRSSCNLLFFIKLRQQRVV